jgi:hypothetical protein
MGSYRGSSVQPAKIHFASHENTAEMDRAKGLGFSPLHDPDDEGTNLPTRIAFREWWAEEKF